MDVGGGAPGAQAGRDIVGIAISTGGPNALSQLMAQIRGDFSPSLLIVQHMPEGFTEQFATRLAKLSAIDVHEAREGEVVSPSCAFVAPGGQHMELVRESGKLRLRLTLAEPVNGHRPSADVLFRSMAKVVGPKCVGVVMTGMGEDGADGASAIHEAGGYNLAQDEASSVVFGMPKAAIERGVVDKVLPFVQNIELLEFALVAAKGGSVMENFRFLVVDDSEFARRNMKKILTAVGGEAAGFATNGREAIDQYMKLRPDVVFMDITMPEMEGVEAVQTIMDRDASAKVVMVSSNGYQELIKEALDSGAKHFLTKPVEPTQVASVVDFVLGEG